MKINGQNISISDEQKKKLLKLGVLGGLLWVLKGAVDDIANSIRKKKTEADMDTDPSAGQAEALKAAMNPSGNYWMRYFDGTNTEGVFETAKEIKDLDKVNDHYKSITDDHVSVYDALQSELSSEDYQKFLAIATKGKTGSSYYAPTRDDIPANAWVVSRLNTNVRKTPVFTHTYNLFNNILKTVSPNKILGVSTGKFSYDESAKVLFVEFWTLTRKNEKKIYYAAKSQVEILTNEQKEKREKAQGALKLELLDGLKEKENKEPVLEVRTKRPTEVLDEKFKQVGLAPKGIMLGKMIMSLDTGTKKYVQVKTIQGLTRWVSSSDIEIIHFKEKDK